MGQASLRINSLYKLSENKLTEGVGLRVASGSVPKMVAIPTPGVRESTSTFVQKPRIKWRTPLGSSWGAADRMPAAMPATSGEAKEEEMRKAKHQLDMKSR